MPSVKIGAVTVGQAPRVDVTADILPLLPGVELLEKGGLDGLKREDIAAFQPEEGDYVLVSRLTDGSSVTFAEKYVLPRLQKAITELEDAGCRLILFFCTGDFPDTFQSRVPLLFPSRVLKGVAPAISSRKTAIVNPSPLQKDQCLEKWSPYLREPVSFAVSPYEGEEGVRQCAQEVAETDCDMVILDCIGYTQKMKEIFQEETGKRVILPRTLLARVAMELL